MTSLGDLMRLFEKEREPLQFKSSADRFADVLEWQIERHTVDYGKQASELDKVFPRDLALMEDALNDPELPIEHRAKILEVMIYRGAMNEASYAGLGDPFKYADERRDGLRSMAQWSNRELEFAERRKYQEAAAHK